jgi:hypothetical protein
VGETIELTDVVLRIIGAFYAFGGFVATRAGLMSQFIDQAIAAIALKKPTRTETAHTADGRKLAVRLKRERPDLMVYVLEADTGVVEVHADEN